MKQIVFVDHDGAKPEELEAAILDEIQESSLLKFHDEDWDEEYPGEPHADFILEVTVKREK